ncbi:Uncharacterised protein [Edwardsiella tarda]|nr:Uncharacterised protein [Edwardsiella tarda]
MAPTVRLRRDTLSRPLTPFEEDHHAQRSPFAPARRPAADLGRARRRSWLRAGAWSTDHPPRGEPDPTDGRDRRPTRPLRLRQVHPAAHHLRPDRPQLRRGRISRRLAPRPGRRGGDGIPDLRPLSLVDGATERGGGAGGAGDARRRAPSTRAGGHRSDRPGWFRERLPARTLRRHAATRRLCPRLGGRSHPAVDGRAVLGARCVDRRDPAYRSARSVE